MINLIPPASIQHLIDAYGLWVLFGVVMMESMGMPLPGETALVTTAIYAGTTHGISILYIILVAATAAITGDNLGYLLGRVVGPRLLLRYGRYVRLDVARLKVGQYLFLRHGGKVVFFGRFVALLRTFSALLAGTNQMPWAHFLVMNGLGGICWAALFSTGAYMFGEQIKVVAGPVSIAILVAAIAAVIIGLQFFRQHERELVARAEEALRDHEYRIW